MPLQKNKQKKSNLGNEKQSFFSPLIAAGPLLPGAQALLGFQITAVLTEVFRSLSLPFQIIHLMSLVLVSLGIILIASPAAFHRLEKRRKYTEKRQDLSKLLNRWGLLFLGIGLAGDFFLVSHTVLQSMNSALFATGALLLIVSGSWLGLRSHAHA